MKKLLTCFSVFLLTISISIAQDSPYQQAMKKEISVLIEADSLTQFRQSANAFVRIAEMNPTEWQPLYYQSLAYTYQGLHKTLTLSKKDEALAIASALAKKAEELSPENTEIITLQGFILMAEVSADPSGRGQSLSGQVISAYRKALAIDANNPRALVLMAQMEYGMAQFLGNETEKACKLARQSQAIFAGQNEETLKAAILPTWGKNLANKLVSACEL